MEQEKDNKGRFTKKSNFERKIRSIRATDEVWDLLGEKAEDNDMTRADYLEALVNEEIKWSENETNKLDLDFEVDEVIKILENAMSFKGNATKKMKLEIRKALDLMGADFDELEDN